MSAATAICYHLRDWLSPVEGTVSLFSMGVLTTSSNHPYQDLIPEGIVFSFPVNGHDGSIYPGLNLSDDPILKELITTSVNELLEEREFIEEFLITL